MSDSDEFSNNLAALAPRLRVRQVAGQPGKLWLHIDRMLDVDTVIRIVDLIRQADKREET